ncbi:flagellar type III secretion system protein FlhB [Roseomonas sp. OT10]|uniref:EscU/YscU/HrcU family type III secretion system export apparatus switch protein n=1 Tax=Roseomonas cutis TaxID=2897332 RepID=UPI001E421AEB|nr:EscU/YscU/HrcU family type III secretion system export apparatus switch protein [Roseomonas sp. OT10]UFN48613.1 flagellar type III secretion system protein FlhB [Roseomonas sp. OT10]
MAGEGGEAEDRTEAPTPRRLEKAREEGQVPLSREAVGLATLLLASGAAALALPAAARDLLAVLRGLLSRASALAPVDAWGLAGPVLLALLPVAGAVTAGAVAATLLQTGGMVSGKGLAPQLSRLSPLAGAKRILGPQGAAELLRAVVKLGAVAAALWQATDDPATLRAVLSLPPGALLEAAAGQAARMVGAVLTAMALLAAADLGWVRFRHWRQLRMSRQELKEESKESEGDPHVKARQRQLRQQSSRRRMMAAVPKATVVVTNPTHYAVALAYQEGGNAPRVVAKGVDAMAARIREAARGAGVPLVANPPLARALYRLELETEIPAEHYAAVAEIIAFVWRRRPG